MGCKERVPSVVWHYFSNIKNHLRVLENSTNSMKAGKWSKCTQETDKQTFAISEIMPQVEVWVDFSWVFIKKKKKKHCQSF